MSHTIEQIPGTSRPFHQIGKGVARTDAAGKAVGKTLYAGDYALLGMLHAKVLRSPIASATVRRVDASKARALKGVVSVITAADLPDRSSATDIPGQTGQPRLKTDQPILAGKRVRYHGEPLALIAAETLDIAEQAMALIEFDLEPLPGVFDPEEASKPGAVLVYGDDNVVSTHKIRKGDINKGFQEADLIVERTYQTQFVEHAFLEPEVGLAWVDENGVINIRVCTQVIEHFRDVADAIGVPHDKVRIIGSMVGGGFGGKEDMTVEVYLALLALQTKRAVRLEFTREDSFFGHGKRHPVKLTYKTGVKRDGRITAEQVHIIADAGAYVFLSPYVLLYAVIASQGPYRIDNFACDAKALATNNMYTSAFRGFGSPQACIAYEQHMDEVANELGMDKIELRRRNYLKTGDLLSTGFPIQSAVWTEQCVDEAWAALGEPTPVQPPLKIGRGVAAYQQSYGRLTYLHDTSEVWLGIEVDGTVVVRSGVTDIGGGQASSLAQISAELLGVTLDKVVVYNSDSATTPLSGTTTATRGLYMVGNAAKLAAEAVRSRLVERAAKLFEVDASEIDLAHNDVLVIPRPATRMRITELVKICAAEGIHRSELAIFRAPFSGKLDPETGHGQSNPDFTYGAHAIEVSVDTETGEIKVLKSIAAHDVGLCINRAAVEGQIDGGAVQGQGYALYEEMLYKQGQLVSPSLSEYLIPTAEDLPEELKMIILESRSGLGPFGSKGIGEPALTAVAPAIANAVADAIGVRVFSLPITPEKVVRALDQKREHLNR